MYLAISYGSFARPRSSDSVMRRRQADEADMKQTGEEEGGFRNQETEAEK